MPPAIPPREPVGEAVNAAVLALETADGAAIALCLGLPGALPEGVQVSRPYAPGVLRFGVRFLGKPHLSVVPGLVAVDYGTMLTGEGAWDFLFRRSTLYPRAEVFGYRNDGRDEMLYLKQLDVALAPEPLFYADDAVTVPAAKPTALIAPDAAAISDRMRAAFAGALYLDVPAWCAAHLPHDV
jgi:hypothetical protein